MEASDSEGPCQAGVFVSYELGWGATMTRVVKPFSSPLTSLSSASGLASRWSGSWPDWLKIKNRAYWRFGQELELATSRRARNLI